MASERASECSVRGTGLGSVGFMALGLQLAFYLCWGLGLRVQVQGLWFQGLKPFRGEGVYAMRPGSESFRHVNPSRLPTANCRALSSSTKLIRASRLHAMGNYAPYLKVHGT